MNKKYNCKLCNYHINNKFDFGRYTKTKKHIHKSKELATFVDCPKSGGLSSKNRSGLFICQYCNRSMVKQHKHRHLIRCKAHAIFFKKKRIPKKKLLYKVLKKNWICIKKIRR